MGRLLALTAAVAALALAPPALAGGPTMTLGVAEDVVRAPDLATAKARFNLLRVAGFDAVRVTSVWRPGLAAPEPEERAILAAVDGAARLTGIRLYLTVYAAGSRTTPLTEEHQAQFAAYAASIVSAFAGVRSVIVGNEPNLNRFWLPQFNPDGSSASPAAYLALLARTYDAVKSAAPDAAVWGGALASRGVDRPGTGRDTLSPTRFIRDLGIAYRASGRTLPVMDGIALHPYPGSSSRSPVEPNPRSTAIGIGDYDRLVALLAEAFDGTAQPGSTLPVLYSELGVETQVPEGKRATYSGQEPATTHPTTETNQAAFYGAAMRAAFCQPNVVGLLLFHSHDEPGLANWQSGLFYADGSQKTSLTAVRDAVARARGGSIARCEGLALRVVPAAVRFAAPARGDLSVSFRCPLDCAGEARLERANGTVVRASRTWARAGTDARATIARRGIGPGTYRLRLSVAHAVNPAPPFERSSAPLVLR